MLWNKSEVKKVYTGLEPSKSGSEAHTRTFLMQPIQTAYTCIYCSVVLIYNTLPPPFFFLKDRYGTIHSSMLLLQLSSMVTLKVSRQTLTWSGHGKSTQCPAIQNCNIQGIHDFIFIGIYIKIPRYSGNVLAAAFCHYCEKCLMVLAGFETSTSGSVVRT